jgi:uncharacterized protein (TIGR02646 family)
MIRTPRNCQPPPELVANAKQWTARFKRIADGSKSGDWATRRAKKALAGVLLTLAHGKCVYCETALGVDVDPEIEHYLAKTRFPDLAFEWTNLLPSCRLCNRPKGDEDHHNLLLKPDIEDPEPFFWIHPDTGRLEPHPTLDVAQTRRANETIRLCDLQRAALCSQRTDMLERVGRWLRLASAETAELSLIEEEWDALTNPRTQYKFVLRHVLRLKGLTELVEEDRLRFEEPAT